MQISSAVGQGGAIPYTVTGGKKKKVTFRKTGCQYSCFAANKTGQPKHPTSIFSQYENAIGTLSKVLRGGKEFLCYSFLSAERPTLGNIPMWRREFCCLRKNLN